MELATRAYSFLDVKALDDGRRRFSGVATTPHLDRMRDSIDPMGVRFKNPLVLLHQHDHSRPIGTVRFHKPTKGGVEFDAEIPVVEEASSFKDRVDTAWAEIKYGVVRAVSVGFRALKYNYRDDGGIDYEEVEVIELSAVSVPANAAAIISSVKGYDLEAMNARVRALVDAERRGGIPLISKTHEGSVRLHREQ